MNVRAAALIRGACAAVMVLTGCASAERRLDLVPRVLDRDLSDQLMNRATHVRVRHQITQLADVWVVPMRVDERLRLHQSSGATLEWLEPARAGTAVLIAINAAQEPYRVLRKDNGWQIEPAPDKLQRIERTQLGEIELVLPPVTPWSQVYVGWYDQPVSGGTLWLRKDGYSVRAPIP